MRYDFARLALAAIVLTNGISGAAHAECRHAKRSAPSYSYPQYYQTPTTYQRVRVYSTPTPHVQRPPAPPQPPRTTYVPPRTTYVPPQPPRTTYVPPPRANRQPKIHGPSDQLRDGTALKATKYRGLYEIVDSRGRVIGHWRSN